VVAAGGAVSEVEQGGPLPVLWQLRFSHYNEKARWALDYKGIRHVRRSLLPGLHPRRAKRLSGGSTTPVLEWGGAVFGDSTDIIAELERRSPEPALYPASEEERRRALDLEEHFDTELGPYIRGALFDALIPERHLFVACMTQGVGAGTRLTYTALSPLTGLVLRRVLINGIGGPEVCQQKTLAAFDRLEAELDGDYLVGDSFSVADLTAAALFCPLVVPPEFPYEWPDRWPAAWDELREPLMDRPGYHWISEIYRRHRGTSAEVAG
jgi:glutathione S-transferase